ncbi:MAG: hypothetical protein IPP90_07750 [Gemmatimonadaceae bacterium]|nr:hypothetical protein [Gemmatimonadaceae bacterium]
MAHARGSRSHGSLLARGTVGAALIVVTALQLSPAVATAQGATWRIQPSPMLRLGVGNSDADIFTAPAGATRLPNGHVVVGDLGDWALREYSPSGLPVKQFGRKGKGPGEVSYLAPLLRCGDSLVANDIVGSQLSVFSTGGQFVRAFRIKAPIYRVGCNARLQLVVMGWETKPTMHGGLHRPLYPYLIASADTTPPILLGEFPGSERFGPRPYPLGREPRVAIGSARAYVALADSFEVLVFDLQGKALRSLAVRRPRIAATAADLVAAREAEIAALGERARSRVESDYASMPLPKNLPATRELIVDADDNLWVQDYPRASSATVRWTVFAPTGTMLATIALPTAFELYEAGRDYVLGRYVDPNEAVPEVRLYRLTRR